MYVEDIAAKIFAGEVLSKSSPDAFTRSAIVPFGSSQVGTALGMMALQNRFARPTCVFLDGDGGEHDGCHLLPGGDPPERVVFAGLRDVGWANLSGRISRDAASINDACRRAMTVPEHHDWLRRAANELRCGTETLWQAMCAEWAATCMTPAQSEAIVGPIEALLV